MALGPTMILIETSNQFSGYVWSDWTTKTIQPMHIDDALKAMIDQPARSGASPAMRRLTSVLSRTHAVNKGSYASIFSTATPFPDSSEDVSMEASADKRSRESPDTTLKPDGKSLKTSEAASPSLARQDASGSCAADTLMFDVSVEQEATSKPPTIRRRANDASEARLLTRQMHRRCLKRIPAWKFKMCVEALNARPIDHTRVTEVTEIQFASDELVDVAAQCLVDLAKESEAPNDSAGHASAASAAPSQIEKESADAGQAPQEPEKEPEGAAETPGVLTGEGNSQTRVSEQCATAQGSTQPTSSTAAPVQDATASSEETTCELQRT